MRRRCVDVFSTYPGFSALWMPVCLGKASSLPYGEAKVSRQTTSWAYLARLHLLERMCGELWHGSH